MINQDTILAKYDDKTSNYYLLDVRSPMEFSEGHIPGSINLPLSELEARIAEIPRAQHIITICAHGVRSGKAEAYLNSKGFQADSLQNGLALWKGQLE